MNTALVRVILPSHLRVLAKVDGEITLPVDAPVSQVSLLNALELQYPSLRGTIRDHVSLARRPFVRFFACEQDLSHDAPDKPLPDPVLTGIEPFIIVGAIAGGSVRR
jgi:hypothetical protein